MKITQPLVEIIDQPAGLQGIFQMIELAGRTCYKSENRITETSAQEFVNRMIESKHFSMLEQGTVYLKFPAYGYKDEDGQCLSALAVKYYTNYSKRIIHNEDAYITTNYRVLVENNWLDDLKYLCEPTEFHERRVSVKFSTQIIITR